MDNPILVTKSSIPAFEEYTEEIKDIWNTHWLSNMGIKHQKLEAELKRYLQADYLTLCTNGHLALETAIQAMQLTGEVITTPFTFASTTHAIVRCGLTPVFCDIKEDTYTIDENKIEELITERTSAILPVHVYGNVCNLEKIEQIALKYGLKVIYDAAHTVGVTYQGKGIGSFGDASVFSFHATKVFNTIEGGAICCKDITLHERFYSIKNFGMNTEGEVIGLGGNAKMNEFQAAMGLCNLRHLTENIEKRKQIVNRYRKHLQEISGITFVDEQDKVQHNYAYFPILVDQKQYGMNRDEVCDLLKEANIFARKYFYPLTSEFGCYRKLFPIQRTPIAERIAEGILTLPLYPDLEWSIVDQICEIIRIGQRHGEKND